MGEGGGVRGGGIMHRLECEDINLHEGARFCPRFAHIFLLLHSAGVAGDKS